MSITSNERPVLAVSELNRQVKRLLEDNFTQVWVQGEISNMARPQSGHWYFSLKDDQAQIRCAMFRNRNRMLRFKPDSGDEVIVRGRVSLYEGRGDYQLIVENLQPAGAGALQQQLEQLKAQLLAEGLFAAEQKQALPPMPRHVAIISSPTGAALQDILSVFRRRSPQVLLSVLPVSVQGAAAEPDVVAALQSLNEQGHTLATPVDAVIIARGGGSLEDLWAFNGERLVRAVHACGLPVVSAVGHETDITLCDLAADARAPTPSAAAELLSPDSAALLNVLGSMQHKLVRLVRRYCTQAQRELDQTARLLRHPGRRLEDHNQRCDELAERLLRAMHANQNRQGLLLQHATAQLQRFQPQRELQAARQRLQASSARLPPAWQQVLSQKLAEFGHLSKMLHTVSPLATLQRGYAIVESDPAPRRIIRNASELQQGDTIRARLAEGSVLATVIERD